MNRKTFFGTLVAGLGAFFFPDTGSAPPEGALITPPPANVPNAFEEFEKRGRYRLGNKSPTPFTRTYSSFAGTDATVAVNGDNVYPTGISWKVIPDTVPGSPRKSILRVQGSLLSIVDPQDTADFMRYATGKHTLTVTFNSKFGERYVTEFSDFVIEAYGTGISVDDIVLEKQWTWRGVLVRDMEEA